MVVCSQISIGSAGVRTAGATNDAWHAKITAQQVIQCSAIAVRRRVYEPAGLKATGASGELIVDWLRAHHFAVMAIDEKARRLVPADSIDLRTPSFGGELVRAFNLYCSRN